MPSTTTPSMADLGYEDCDDLGYGDPTPDYPAPASSDTDYVYFEYNNNSRNQESFSSVDSSNSAGADDYRLKRRVLRRSSLMAGGGDRNYRRSNSSFEASSSVNAGADSNRASAAGLDRIRMLSQKNNAARRRMGRRHSCLA